MSGMPRAATPGSSAGRPGLAGLLAVATLAVAAGLPDAIRTSYLDLAECEGPSMEPTLREGDWVLVDRTAYGARSPLSGEALARWALPEPGDVVVAVGPPGEGLVVKRVLGLPGDRIAIEDDVVVRNGEACPRRPIPCDWARAGERCAEERLGGRRWRTIRAEGSPPETRAEVVVPAGHLFLLGDHRDASYDSRDPVRLGFVPVARVVGRVRALVFSPFPGRAPAAVP